MRTLISRLLKIIFVLCLAGYVFTLFYKPPLPTQENIKDEIKNIEPIQESVEIDTITLEYEDFKYEINPQFSYDIYGLIVSQYDSRSFWDIMHENDPANLRDLCLVWGENIKNDSYLKAKYSNGEFSCSYRFSEPNLPFIHYLFSNNHLIPANEEVATIVNSLSIGDQVHVKGYLSDYQTFNYAGDLVSERGTSTTRKDEGNGACETIYVTDIELLQTNDSWVILLKKYSPWGMGASLLLFILLLYIPEKKKKVNFDK